MPLSATGISVVICCWNGAPRLPQTLSHLLAQRTPGPGEPGGFPWEVIFVDNASTDTSADYARSAWTRTDAPLRLLYEPKLGMGNARITGVNDARYSYVCFVDDDNWLAPDYLATAFAAMEAQPQVGACGGLNEPVLEAEKPPWLDEHQGSFALGPQVLPDGSVRDGLYGAGLIVRRAAWDAIFARGFRFRTGRQGNKNLVAGDDFEMCYAIRRCGWELLYEPRMRLQHYMPKGRMTWSYVRRLAFANGVSSVYLDRYDEKLADRSWRARAASTAKVILGATPRAARSLLADPRHNSYELLMRYLAGRITTLLKLRSDAAIVDPFAAPRT